MRLFRLILVRQSYELGLVLNVRITNPDSIIVCVRSTVCNHRPVLRGCMIMQSTTCQSLFRSASLSPINCQRRYRPSCIYVSVCVFRRCRSSRSRAERLQSASANKEQGPEIERSTEHLAALLCSVITASILLGSNSNWPFRVSAIRSLTWIIVRVLTSHCNTMASQKRDDA